MGEAGPGRAIGLRRLPGLTPYEAALRLQRDLLRRRQSGEGGDVLLLLEHEPVVTLGRNADPAGLLVPAETLAGRGIGLHRAERGGQATYHGPGQAVVYPILRLAGHGLGVRAYVNRLEEVMLRAAERFGVGAARWPGRPGVYVGNRKLGAVGVAVSRGISYHGLAFNVRPDLSPFRLIVPCGLTDVEAVSLAALLPEPPDMDAAFAALAAAFGEAFGCSLAPEPPG